jgi:hypothetical protein
LIVYVEVTPVRAATDELVATNAVQVTSNPDPVRAHSSPQVAHNPETRELVVVEADVRGDRSCSVHISVDGGRSWFPGGEVMVEPFTDCTIGAEWGTYFNVFFDAEGTLYVPFAANDPRLFDSSEDSSELRGGQDRKFVPRNLFLAKSDDGGRTFQTTTVYEAPAGNPALGFAYGVMGAVDPTDADRVYVTWAQGDFLDPTDKTSAVLAASSDGGRTFLPPVDITDERGSEQAWITVDREGTLHAAWWSLGFDSGKSIFERGPDDEPLAMVHSRSTGQGRTWSHRDIEPGTSEYTRHPVLLADPNSSALYVVWFGNPEPNNLPLKDEGKDITDIFVRASLDGGEKWGERLTVNEDIGNKTNQAHPGASIAPDGRLDIAWYDFRSSPRPADNWSDDTGIQDVYYASSNDQGQTFSSGVRITDRSIDRSIGVWSNNIGSAAPVGVASTEDAVYFAWQDTRNGNPIAQAEDVYFSSAKLEGGATVDIGSTTPRWPLIAAGVAIGMGIAMASVWAFARRTRNPPARLSG